jgi:hypothetical protein
MGKLRVIQWNTGKVGKHSTRAIIDDPRLKLVGMFAHSPDKVGKDAGELCGRADVITGVKATSDVDALVRMKADTVLYTPFEANLDHAIALLESGKDVVSTNLFLNVGGITGKVKKRLEKACKKGNSSLYITGINPGWVNSITAALTAVCRKVSKVHLIESADCSVYESVETWSFLGIGEPGGATPELLERAQAWLILFRDAVQRIGDAIEVKYDEIEFFCEYATAAETVDLGWFKMEKGTNAALRGGWIGKVGGEERVRLTVIWYLTTKLAEGWEIDPDQHRIEITGEPDVTMRLRYTPTPGWTNHDWDVMTALPAVSALAPVGLWG